MDRKNQKEETPVKKVPDYTTPRICGKSIWANVIIAENNRTGKKHF